MITRDQRGFSLAETITALAILGLVLPVVFSVFYLLMSIPIHSERGLETSLEAGQAVEMVARDGRSAVSFSTPTAAPDYGTFSWIDYTRADPITYSVRYYYESGSSALVRQETAGSSVFTRHVARNVASYGDVSFVPGGSVVSVTVKSTIISPVSASNVVTKEASTLVTLRSGP